MENSIPAPRLIVNGNSVGRADLRSATSALRENGMPLDVRSTSDIGDVKRFVDEAVNEGVRRLVTGGGDSSINQFFDALLKHERIQND